MQCLAKNKPVSTKADVPGARNRYDDFVAAHIKLAPHVHFSVLLSPLLAPFYAYPTTQTHT